MQRKHDKQMEHLRFLVHNRLNAKSDAAAPDSAAAGAPETPTPSQPPAEAGGAAAAAAAADGAYDPSEDMQHQADWKESIKPIGYLRSCFRRKVRRTSPGFRSEARNHHRATSLSVCVVLPPPPQNSTPRQPNLVPGSVASLKVTFFDNSEQSLEGLEHYSHVWLIFYFHLNDNVAVKPKVGRRPQAR